MFFKLNKQNEEKSTFPDFIMIDHHRNVEPNTKRTTDLVDLRENMTNSSSVYHLIVSENGIVFSKKNPFIMEFAVRHFSSPLLNEKSIIR